MACRGMIFLKNFKSFRKQNVHFVFIHLIFKCYFCSMNLKRQSEHSGLRPDASSLVPIWGIFILLQRHQPARHIALCYLQRNFSRKNIVGRAFIRRLIKTNLGFCHHISNQKLAKSIARKTLIMRLEPMLSR